MNQQAPAIAAIEIDQNNFYPKPIYINHLKSDVINLADIDPNLQVLIIKQKDEILVLADVCPHMGGDLSKGKYCSKAQTLQCPWHGYIFDLTTLTFSENPNELIWDQLRYPTTHFKPKTTPKYRLNKLGYEIYQDKIYIRRQSNP
jgi:nitrite reductase/ring-hydroxylating ferredoxin subunit